MEPATNGWQKMKHEDSIRRKSLLHKTFRLFACCIAVCLALTAPLFYLLTKHFYAEDIIELIGAVEHGQNIPPLDLEEDIMIGMMIQFLLIFLSITLALFITLRLVTKKLWQPFDDTLRKTERFNLAQGEIPAFEETDIQEFARLNHSLSKLMEKDKETYRIQKEFTENASHELQTPIAIIRSELDLLMQEGLNERQMKLVSDLYGLTIRMGHLNRNLLLLAKIENKQYTAMEETDIASLLSASLPLYDTLCDGNILHVDDCRINQTQKIRANAVLLECMLKNLIVNAIRHSVPKSEIRIRIEDNRLSLCNTSVSGKPLDANMLFRRFHKDDACHKGNGLGLAIVKAICDFHGWSVAYRFVNGHHQFIVTFNNNQTQ